MTTDGAPAALDSHELIATLFTLIPVPVAVADENGTIVLANSSFTETFQGVSSVSTMPQREIDVPGHGRFEVQTLPLNNRGYKIIYATDVTQHAQLGKRVANLEKMAAVGRLVGGVANEMQAPLKDIMDYGPMLERCEMDATARTILGVIFGNAERSAQLVQNLITFAEASASPHVPLDLNEIVRNVVAQRRVRDSWRQFDVTLDLERNLPQVAGNPSQIEQVITALLVHAEDSVAGVPYRHGSILVQSGVRDRRVQLQVADNGQTSAPARMFASDHAGLGLNICGEIAKDHGGELYVWSAYGNGSTFTLELPVYAPESASVPDEAGFDQRLRNKSVMVVDDEVLVSELINDVLSRRGMKVQVVNSGAEACERLCTTEFDLIICDQLMPGVSGESIYKLIESTNPSVNRKFLFVTDNAISAQSRKFFMESGVQYLRKPFRIQDLIGAVEGLLNRSPRRDS